MADGTFAGLMIVLGLIDMGVNHCGTETGCLGRTKWLRGLRFQGRGPAATGTDHAGILPAL